MNTLRVVESVVAESDAKKRTRCLIEDFVNVVSPFGTLRARFSSDVSTSRWTKESSQKVLGAGQNDPYELLRDLQVEQFGRSCATLLKRDENTPFGVLRSATQELDDGAPDRYRCGLRRLKKRGLT
jgi:hypothetical protein